MAQFAAAGIDFIKLDLGCGDVSSIHNNTPGHPSGIESLRRVGEAIKAAAPREMVFYIDAGNSNEAAIWNPRSRGVVPLVHSATHVARSMDEQAWVFGPAIGASMWKIWARPEQNPRPALCGRALLMPQENTGSLYRCG